MHLLKALLMKMNFLKYMTPINLKEIYSYWNSEKINLENFDDAQCLTDFQMKQSIFCLIECLEFPENIVWSQGIALYIVLNRHSNSCTFIEIT